MKISRWLSILFVSLSISACTTITPKPDTCRAVRPYRGAALYPAPKIYPIKRGALDGALDQATQNRLNKALEKAMSATKAKSMTAALGV